jgi:SAM-dependent methyltransferase
MSAAARLGRGFLLQRRHEQIPGSRSSVKDLLSSYPRLRPALGGDHQRIYVSHYQENREGNGWLTRSKKSLESWMHRRVASRQHGREVLEIGAGTLNHLPHEPRDLTYDAVEPFRELWEGRARLSRLRTMYSSLADIPEATRYDRIFSIAVLEHLTDLPRTVASAALRLRPNGRFQAGIPSEGGALWGLAWRLSTGIAFRLRTGLPYADIMRHEHVNAANEILSVCHWCFEEVEIDRFPTCFHHLSFYAVLEARRPRIERCRELLWGRIE